jgi:serine/threonine protein kinase
LANELPLDERWRRIEELYHAALKRDAQARALFLDDACSADPELRQAVESLLSSAGKAGSFLETEALDETATLTLHGNRIGTYQILSPLGAGGMGEVYRAHDSKLGRDVAIKTLPPTFAADVDRLARFRREARILASLNHPNIATIYDLEEAGGTSYLILELVEGNTLKEVLEGSGPMPIPESLRVGCQIAEALEAAHCKGIIHRDLKPANVKITPEGRVKVLDFGLAKAMASEEGRGTDCGPLPSSSVETMVGTVLGTPSYMSPEQARGGIADKRSDVWSFGCLLYELVTGKRAFGGQAVSDTLAAILEREPDWQSVPASIPDKLQAVLKNCLQKDPSLRPADGGEIRRQLEECTSVIKAGLRPWHVAAAATLAGVAIFGAMELNSRDTPRISSPSEWTQITNFPDAVSQPALSPDGKMLTFVRGGTTFAGPGEIYIKALPSGEPVQLTHDGMAKMHPMFSPDGSRIAYTVLGARQSWDTWVVPVFGGPSKLWQTNASGLTWTGANTILFSEVKSGQHMAIVESAEDRSGSRDLYVPPTQEGMAHRSYPSPDGKSVLLVEMEANVWLPCRIIPAQGGSNGHAVGPPTGACVSGAWSKDGRWVYLSVQTGENYHIWRQRLPDGRPEQLTFGTSGEEGIAVEPDGRSLITAVGAQQRAVILHSPTGERQISLEGYAYFPKISADGKKIFFRVAKGTGLSMPFQGPSELWIADLASGRGDRVLPELLVNGYDIAPDGRLVVAASDSAGKSHLWLASPDSRIPPRIVPNTESAESPFFALPGDLAYLQNPRSAYLIREDGTDRRIVSTQVDEIHRVSPDAHWMIAVVKDAQGSVSAAIPLDGKSPSVTIGPFWPVSWSRDSKYFFIAAMDALGTAGAYGRTYSIPLRPGQTLPNIPPGGFRFEREIAALPGARLVPNATPDFAPGPSLETYAYSRISSQRNLYRVPLTGN